MNALISLLLRSVRLLSREWMCVPTVWVGSAMTMMAAAAPELELKETNTGVFSVSIPRGWRMVHAGDGATLAFYAWDPVQPMRKIIYFGSVGPLYMSDQQKQIDLYYMQSGGFPVGWIEMPVIQPFTASNFFSHFSYITQAQLARSFMQPCPALARFTPVAVESLEGEPGLGAGELIRALFFENGRVGEGLFQATMVPFMPFMNGPGGGNGYACLVMGISAPKRELADLEPVLVMALGSFRVNPEYARQYILRQRDVFGKIMEAGKTLRESSEIITKGWERRQKTHDILSEKWSDTMMGTERLYDPDSGEVYEFQNGFYDRYRLDPNAYRMDNLQPLPDGDHTLWMRAPLDGPSHL